MGKNFASWLAGYKPAKVVVRDSLILPTGMASILRKNPRGTEEIISHAKVEPSRVENRIIRGQQMSVEMSHE